MLVYGAWFAFAACANEETEMSPRSDLPQDSGAVGGASGSGGASSGGSYAGAAGSNQLGGAGGGSNIGGSGTGGCPALLTLCGDDCVDTLTDPDNCGSCGYDCELSDCELGTCILASGQLEPTGIAVDGNYVYWTNKGTTPEYLDGTVARLPLAGGIVEVLATAQGGPRTIVADATHIYWLNFIGGTVEKAALDGTNAATLAVDTWYPFDLAIDDTHAYWTQWLGSMPKKIPLAGGDIATMAANMHNSAGIVVGADKVYWTRYSAGIITEANKTIGFAEFVTEQDFPYDIAASDSELYWTNQGANAGQGAVMSMPITGATPNVLAGSQNFPTGIALAQNHLYWTTRGSPPEYLDGQVLKVVLGSTGAPQVIASHQRNPHYLAVDGTSVYWTNSAAGTVVKCAK